MKRTIGVSEPSRFDVGQFVKDYSDSAVLQATVIARAFYLVDQRLDGVDRRLDGVDRRLVRIERVLAEAFPDAYRRASRNGDEESIDGPW